MAIPAVEWQQLGACQGETRVSFFPPALKESREAREAREARAKRVCAHCQVIDDCLAYALRFGERHGIWGGRTETERMGLR